MTAPNVTEKFCPEIKILPLNFTQLLTFELGGIFVSGHGGTHHIVKMKCINRSVTLTTK